MNQVNKEARDNQDIPRGTGQIVVLGMHRSGTSSVGALLHATGAHYADDSVGPPVTDNDENPKGFWEHPELRRICDRLLQASGFEWWSVDQFRPELVSPDVLEEARSDFRGLVAALNPHQPWFLKEPRLCVLLPLLSADLADPVVIHVWRNPLEIAESLRNRNRFSLDFGVALWEAYVRSAFRNARSMPAVMLEYNRLLQSPVDETSRLLDQLSALGIRGLVVPGPERLTEAVDPGLLRSRSDLEAEDLLSPEQMRLLRALEGRDPSNPALYEHISRAALARLNDEAEQASLLQNLQRQASTARQMTSIDRRLAPLSDVAALRSEVARRDDLNALKNGVASLRTETAKSKALDALATDLASLGNHVRRESAATGLLREELAKLREYLGRYAAYIAVRDERIERLSTELAAKQEAVADLSRRLRYERLPFYAKWSAGVRSLVDPSSAAEASWIVRQRLYLRYRLLHRREDARILSELGCSRLFNHRWYLKENPDVARSGMDPLLHYVDYGWREGRDPCPEFETAYYLTENQDVSRARINPLLHYLRYGRAEGRKPVAPPKLQSTPKAGSAVAGGPRLSGAGRRIVVYTAISQGYDELKVPEVGSDRCDFVCFTDADIPGDRGWELRPMDYVSSETARSARYFKTHPHAYFPDYEWSIWVDANLLIKADLGGLVDAAEREGHVFAAFVHPHRDCVYAEAAEVIARGLDTADRVSSQVERYKSAGYPPNNGLTETNVLVRRHNDPQVVEVDIAWWREIENGSHRDQLSLNFVAHKSLLKLGQLAKRGVSVRNDPRFARFLHGADSQYRLPDRVAEAIGTAPGPLPAWQRMTAPGLATPKDLEPYGSIPADIVVCVFNSLEDVRRCLESVADNLRPGDRTIVVDDGSGVETETYCREFAERVPGTVLVRRPLGGSGYTKAANAGLAQSKADYVILLNSDTVVTRHWISKLMQAGESAPDIGLIGPMSNAASWQSLPETTDGKGDLAVNELLPGCTVAHMDQFCELWSQAPLFPRVPVLNGFCLAIKRKVIDTIGLMDEEAFPAGFGEENDYCFRAADAGFALVVATHTYVFHAKSRSYSHERRRALARESGAVFRERWGAERITRAVASTRTNPYLERIRAASRRVLASDSAPGSGLRMLFLLPARSGGGGVHSVMQEASGLSALGAVAKVAVPAVFREEFERDYPGELAGAVVYYSSVDELIELAAGFDQVVATIFSSVDYLERTVEKHPQIMAAYYIQDYEPYFYEKSNTRRDRARFAAATRSYTALPDLLRFAKTAWLQKTLEDKTGGRTYRVQPSLDRKVYFPAATRTVGGPVRIAAMVRLASPRRAPEMTVRILARVGAAHGATVAIHVFGTSPRDKTLRSMLADAPITNHGTLRREDVAALLRDSDVFADFSEYQAFGRTALEAMACGCVAIVPRAGGAGEFAHHGLNSMVVDTSSEEACFLALDELVRDGALRDRLRRRGLETAARYSVENAALSEVLLLRTALEMRTAAAQSRLPARDTGQILRVASRPENGRLGSALPPEKATAAANQYLEPELSLVGVTPEDIQRNAAFVLSMRQLKRVPTDRLLWLVPSFDNIYRGGIRTVFMVADYFARTLRSHNTFVIYGREKDSVSSITEMAAKSFPGLNAEFVALGDEQHPSTLPPSDAAFATLWTSAYLLARYDKCKAKFYMLQDFEPSFYPAGSVYGVIEQTYMLGFHGIANTIGVARKYQNYSDWIEFFTPGVDTGLYHPAPRPAKAPLRVVFYGRPNNNRNAFNLGIEALRLVKDYFGNKVDILSVGSEWPEHRYGVRGVVRNLGVLSSMEEVAALYRSCDIGLVFMFSDHPSYQPLEFMASGCCTVTNFNPSTKWLLRDRENAFLTGATPANVARCIIDALESSEARQRVVHGGLETVRGVTWEEAFSRIADFVANPRPLTGEFRSPFAERAGAAARQGTG